MLVKLTRTFSCSGSAQRPDITYVERLPAVTRNVYSGMMTGVKPALPLFCCGDM